MKEIESLEEAVGKQLEDWTLLDLQTFSLEQNQPLLQLLKNKEVIDECISRTKNNKEVNDVLVPLSIKLLIDAAEETGNSILVDLETKKITSEEAEAKCMSIVSDAEKTTYEKLVAYLILISSFADVDLKSKELEIKENVNSVKEIATSLIELDVSSYYSLITSLLELVFPLRGKYYALYNIDILDDENGVFSIELDKLHDFEVKALEELSKLQESLSTEKKEGDK